MDILGESKLNDNSWDFLTHAEGPKGKIEFTHEQLISEPSGNLFALASAFHKLTRTVGGSETTLIEGSFSHQRDNVNATKFMQSTSSINLQDSPATTSAVTYKLFAKRGSTSNNGNVRQQHMVLLETAV